MSIRLRCPKCAGRARAIRDKDAVVLHCLCGLHRYLFFIQGDRSLRPAAVTQPEPPSLPRVGSLLMQALTVVHRYDPAPVFTGRVAEDSGCSTSDAASQLMVLMGKGLVDRIEEGRGKRGGSQWTITAVADDLLTEREHGTCIGFA